MGIFNRRFREILLGQYDNITSSIGQVDDKVATVQASLDDLFKDLVSELESSRIALAQANLDLAKKQAKIEELSGVLDGALSLVRRASTDRN